MSKDPHKSKKLHSSDHYTAKNDSIYDWLPDKGPKKYDFKNDLIQISRDLIQDKYFEAFNFYFSKPINEILANLSIPHVIMYKDYLYYDDHTEYLKRYYNHEESKPRIHNLSDFYYKATYGLARPTLAIHEQNKIVLKRNNKLHKLYLQKIKNFDEIPQTHRDYNQQALNAEMRILNNLQDESGSSMYGQDEDDAPKEDGGKYNNILDDGEVHNSFQQLLERYENIMSNVSYETTVHDVYNPEQSSASISRGTSPINGYLHSIENQNDEKSLSITNSMDRSGERRDLRVENNPNEFSDFGFSDASDLYIINEMMQTEDNKKGKVEEKPKPKKILGDRKNSKERLITEKESSKNLQQISTQDTLPKRKPNSKTHSSRSSNSFTKKGEPLHPEKRKSAYEEEPVNEKPSRDRNHHTQETRIPESVARTDSLLMREDLIHQPGNSKTLPASHSPRGDSDYLQGHAFNQYNTVHPFEASKKPQFSLPLHKLDADKKRYPSATTMTQKVSSTQPHTARTPITEDFMREGIDTMIERDASGHKPQNSIQYIKDLVQKYQKNSDDFANGKSKLLLDEFKKSSMYAKLTGMTDRTTDKQQMIRDIYSNNDSIKTKKPEGKTSYLTRSKTEDALLKNISQAAMKSKKLNISPSKMEVNSQPNSRVIISPANIRKDKAGYRYVSNEGISLGHVSSQSHVNLLTHISTEHSKIVDNNFDDRFMTGGTNYKTLKIEKNVPTKKSDYKPPLKPTLVTSNTNSNSKVSSTRRLTATNPGSLTNSAQKSGSISINGNSAISMPVSPNRKFEFKLNLARLNQPAPKHSEDHTTENSYGFWTSRSAKGGVDEQQPKSNVYKDLGKMSEDRFKTQESKDYYLRQNYNPQDEKKKEKVTAKTSNSLTRSHPNLDLKFKENEIAQSMKSFNHPTYKTSLSNQIQANLIDAKKSSVPKVEVNSNPTRYSKGVYRK